MRRGKIEFPAKVVQISAKIFSFFLLPPPFSASVCKTVLLEKRCKTVIILRAVLPLKSTVVAAERGAKNRPPSSSLSFVFSSSSSSPLPRLSFTLHALNFADYYA